MEKHLALPSGYWRYYEAKGVATHNNFAMLSRPFRPLTLCCRLMGAAYVASVRLQWMQQWPFALDTASKKKRHQQLLTSNTAKLVISCTETRRH